MLMNTISLQTVSLALLQIISASGTTEFGCKNSLISDEWREKVYELHTKYRKTLAKGKQAGKDGVMLPTSTKTELMHWDCTIEEMAEAALKGCPASPTIPEIPGSNPAAKFGSIFESKKVKAKDCNSVTTADGLIKAWWKEGAKKQEDQKRVKDNDKFAQMAYSESKGFGCTNQICGGNFYLLCLYGQEYVAVKMFRKMSLTNSYYYSAVTKVAEGDNLYTPTNKPDEVCKDCDKDAANNLLCTDALCDPPYTPIVITKSTVCPTCDKDITEDFRVTALDMHNYYRRLLATGWAKDKKIGYAKPATEMNALVYHKDHEDTAYAYAVTPQTCPTAPEGDIGENYWKGDYKLSHVEAIEEAMKEWWGPLESTGLGENVDFTDEMQQGPFKYFANVAHDATTKMGCAVKTCSAQGFTVVDCRYSTAIGIDDPIYKAGRMPCKPCPSGTTCAKLGGLCEAPATP
ncbi:hypothetical protein Y032_0194g1419 [Ancylostoma ceylanicum]|nr:hypothetical protein Y032_0194g1419 [Ancylostoma ceylanicum]